MTCIAWDGRLLAADGMTTYGDQIATLNKRKLHQIKHPTLGPMVVGLCGEVRFMAKWLNAVAEGSFYATLPDDKEAVSGLFVDRDGDCWEADAAGTWEQVEDYAAVGSGAMLAYTALRDGGTAIDAVRFACRHSTSCGGTIRVYCPTSNVITVLR